MTIARHYLMIAKENQLDEMRQALVDLAAKVRPIAGCEGITLFQDARTPTRFTFIEYWASVDAHRAGASQLGKEALDAVMAAIAAPPEGTYLDKIDL